MACLFRPNSWQRRKSAATAYLQPDFSLDSLIEERSPKRSSNRLERVMPFAPELIDTATRLIAALRARGRHLALAESCTGGLIAALLTEVPGSSGVLERGYVVYSNEAKIEALGVPAGVIDRHGAVSAAAAVAMADGALKQARAGIALSVTGIAGPTGGSAQKPVGLVYMALAREAHETSVHRFQFKDDGRHNIRLAAVTEALRLIGEAAG